MEYPHLVLIVIDTLRKDYARLLEDELRRLGFVSYDNVIAPAPWTIPSHASIFTGFYPLLHGAHETRSKKSHEIRLSLSRMLLTNVLKTNYGYNNYLISSNPFVSPNFGFEGFDKYFDVFPLRVSFFSAEERRYIQNLLKEEKSKIQVGLKLIRDKRFSLLSKATLWFFRKRLRKIKQRLSITDWPLDKGLKNTLKIISTIKFDNPIFLFVNLMEVHYPYTVKDPPLQKLLAENLRTNALDKNLVKVWIERYAAEVEYVKGKLVNLFRKLRDKRVFDKSLIIITSDHGQLLGEHGRIDHGIFLYDELIRVPLFIKYPKDYDIEHEIPNETKYISLTKLKPFILSILDNKLSSDRGLYENTVFSESYGIHDTPLINEIKKSISTEHENMNIEQLEKYRIGIYHKNFKGIFNVTDWRFEEVISYDPKIEITEDILKQMKKEIVKFLKTATVVKLPKIKL